MTVPVINWHMLMPELVIVLTFVIVMVFDLFKSIRKSVLAWVTIIGSAIALWASVEMLHAGVIGNEFNGMLRVDRFAMFFNIIFLVSTILVTLISINYLDRKR